MKNTKKVDTLKNLHESVLKCRQLINEKRLNEQTFEELIAPQKQFLKDIADAAASAGLVSLDPEAFIEDNVDIQKVLSVSEKDTDFSKDGTLKEEYYKRTSSLLKLSERSRSYQEIVNDFKKGGGQDDYSAYQEWTSSQQDAEKAKQVRERNFHLLYARAAEIVPEVSVEMLEPSEELKSLIDLVDAGEDIVETAVDTVTTKYELVELKLRRVIRGKSVKRYYMLAGDAGIGKTYIVNELLKEVGLEPEESGAILPGRVPVVTGSIGRNPTTVAEFLWKYKDAQLVILDDCDTFLRKDANPDVLNILKGAMEPGTHYHVHITANIANRLTRLFAKNESLINSSNGTRLVEGEIPEDELADDEEGDETEDDDLSEFEDELEAETSLDTKVEIPTDWTFNPRLVIISNLHEKQINEAIWSRCDHYDLHLTQEEYLVRLGMIINDMDIGQKDGIYTEEQAISAKALIMTVLGPLIEAGNKGIKMFGRYIHLKQSLEFRLVKDIADMWLSMVERYMEVHPDANEDDVKKALLKKWVRIIVIPRISASAE